MKTIKTYKYQLRPSKEKQQIFHQTLGVCRLIYNLSLEYKSLLWSHEKINVSKTQLQTEVAQLAKEYDYIKAVHSQVRQNAIHRLLRSYDNFFKQGAGFPKYAKRGFYNSFTYPQGVKVDGNYIYLPKIGWITMYKNRALPKDAQIKTTTIIKEADAWHVSITFETEQAIKYPFDKNQACGFDVGVQYYYVSSKDEFIENPRFLKEFEGKIARLNRKLARQKKGSNRRNKTKLILRKTYLKLKRKRADFIHKLTYNIVKNNSLIMVEDLSLQNMTKSAKGTQEASGKNIKQKSGLNKSLLDLGAGEFYRQLEYKSNWNGRKLIKVNPAYTSQTCASCGHVDKANRQTQSKFCCISCGHTAHADANAAKNILRRGLSVYREREALACA